MTVLLGYYALFALATGIAVCFDHLAPVIKLREKSQFVENKVLLYIVTLTVSTVVAPLVFFSCIIPSLSDKAKLGLYTGLFGK